ncbi:MAG: desulfoferrodoxin FeS4 iron-binding domain-containing protein [Candidatus Aenigmarchaeota archaeon]|nr:desulfoferrodoxin FeS4 iron-binding domain-containing protein [Candidatus Aenigmarchaeota archaeon]
MPVKFMGERYRCEICGNEVSVTKVGGGILSCCDQPMTLLEEE